MAKAKIWLSSALVMGGVFWGCGSSDSGLEDGSGSGGSAGSGTGGTGASSSSGGSAGSSCEGTHPMMDGGERRCGEGECRCLDSDTCLPEATAAACCGDGELECFREGGKFECKGEHPQLDGGTRFCLEGACYCEGRDACMPADQAAACCPDTPKC